MNHGATSTSSTNAPPTVSRPIRFVTNHDGPYAKRRRINSACLTCRKKKTRCSGERPVCGTCAQNKHECAGYGTETDNHVHSPTEVNKDGKRMARRESNTSSTAPARKLKQDAAPQPTRPPLPHATSSSSQLSDAAAHVSSHNHDDASGSLGLSLSTRNRMPYFRYFGPTAIMPGFKQMVVKVRGKQHSTGHTGSDPLESSPGLPPSLGSPPAAEAQTPVEIPVYDTSAMAPSPLITHLCKTFFAHLGCSFPFLQRDRFMRDLEEKQVDAILVDAVCALAARFSTHPLLVGNAEPPNPGAGDTGQLHRSEYGQAFAQRAKSAIPDAFPCPSVAVVQAALLIAYDEFGANRDSGLWMYLGISIRMAQDLGMQTLEGLKYEGRDGPTPKSVKTDSSSIADGGCASDQTAPAPRRMSSAPAEEEQRAVERERLDTFWSLFFLDRVISSGTGRPVTLRDKDIQISFPSLDEVDPTSGYPLPFPALIRIVHLYGRVTDLLNSIKEKAHITEDIRKQLDNLEYQLTGIYQGLSPKLHFNAFNFQHHVKINQGTNFLLLHCWFHTLIVLLHQPTLLKTFEGNVQHLSSNSRELSMSSAKTVADILAFADLIDAKTGVGNPFTSQPIYIAACAFLKETALHSASSQPHSRPTTPAAGLVADAVEAEKATLDHVRFDKASMPANGEFSNSAQDKQAAKHTLLASAANQNYQRCYRALKSLETYWAGVKYILTVLDQKAKGVGDPLLYTREEMESALELPRPEPAFTSPGWRRKLSWGTYLTAEGLDAVETTKMPSTMHNNRARTPTIAGSPLPLPSQAIGWSLTGTMNSPSTNVAVMYTSETNAKEAKPMVAKLTPETSQSSLASVLSTRPTNFRVKYGSPSMLSPSTLPPPTTSQQNFDPSSMPPPSIPPSLLPTPTSNFNALPTPDAALVSDADLLLNLHSPYSAPSPKASRTPLSPAASSSYQHHNPLAGPNQRLPSQNFSPTGLSSYPATSEPFGDMVIDSQEVDMSFLGPDIVPWDMEYLPHEMFLYGDSGFMASGNNNPDVGE